MRTLGNLLWFIMGGVLMGLGWCGGPGRLDSHRGGIS